jgi:hypothetical protein
MAITLRLTKGSELTHTELDGNFTDLDTQITKTKTVKAVTVASGVLALDHSDGDAASITVAENVTSVTLANPPAAGIVGSITLFITQDATGGRTFAGTYLTDGGAGLDISVNPNAKSIVTFLTTDGGATYFGMSGGKNYV